MLRPPLSIQIICISAMVAYAISIPTSLVNYQPDNWFEFIVFILLLLIPFILDYFIFSRLWRMKKWAAYVEVVVLGISLFILAADTSLYVTQCLIRLWAIFSIARHVKTMT